MNSVRCGSCGLLNFASTEACKRCDAPLTQPQAQAPPPGQFHAPETQAAGPYAPDPWAAQPYYSYQNPAAASGKSKSVWVVGLAVLCMVALISIPLYLKFGRGSSLELSWKPYKAADESFSLMVPGEPSTRRDSKSMGGGTIYTEMSDIKVDNGKTLFAFGYAQISKVSNNVPVDMMFDYAIGAMAGRTGATIANKKDITLETYRGVEVEVYPPASAKQAGDKGVFRFYWVPPRIYIIGVGGPDSSAAEAYRAKYLDSFKLGKMPIQ